jgi:glycosyltransferase involved in cell wall biosynthesis
MLYKLFIANHKYRNWNGYVVLYSDGTLVGGKKCESSGSYEFSEDCEELTLIWDNWSNLKLKKTGTGYTSNKMDLRLVHHKDYKISICTTCMGRLQHLQETLPKNLVNINKYDNIEVVLLDYNSKDGLEEWVKENYLDLIERKRLVYIKTTEPEYFNMSHAKNMAHKYATGDILCNIDADNYIMPDYIPKIIRFFSENKNTVLKPNSNSKGNGGRISVSREMFHKIRGYDENTNGWGNEDQDFFNKCIINGATPRLLRNAPCISHSDVKRGENYEESGIRNSSRKNYRKMYNAIKQGKFVSNKNGWGEGEVTVNFKTKFLDKLSILDIDQKFSVQEKDNRHQDYIMINLTTGEVINVWFYKEPKCFLTPINGNKIKGIGSHWFNIGFWDLRDGFMVLKYYHDDDEIILNQRDDRTYSNSNIKFILEKQY